MSSSGNGSPRSSPSAAFIAAAAVRHAEAAVVVDVGGAAARRARTCRADRPSRWSATRRRRRPPRHAPACLCTVLQRARRCDRAPRPSWPGRAAPFDDRTSGVVSRSGCARVAAGRPSLDAEAALVDRETWRSPARRATPAVPRRASRTAARSTGNASRSCDWASGWGPPPTCLLVVLASGTAAVVLIVRRVRLWPDRDWSA